MYQKEKFDKFIEESAKTIDDSHINLLIANQKKFYNSDSLESYQLYDL